MVLKPDHVREIDVFAERFKIRAFGPYLFWRDDVPRTELEHLYPWSVLPGDIHGLHDGRAKAEVPVWIPEHQTIVFADALTEREGELRVWFTPWHEQSVLPAMRAMLDLPFERVIVSHGEPVHDRSAFERALDMDPWME